VNGNPTDEIKNQKGLRQGNPLAPFLFLMVADGLGGLMRMATDKDLFVRPKVGR